MFNPLKKKLEGLRIILGTSSKQRHAILQNTGLRFEAMDSNFDEDLNHDDFTFEEFVKQTAKGKVLAVLEKTKNDRTKPGIVIGLDTMVCHDGKMYGKAKSREEAARTIKTLANSGLPHVVYTGVVIYYRNGAKEEFVDFIEKTEVYMHALTDEEISGYIDTGEYVGKAGSYAIQGIASSFVERIKGDYHNVIGLPLCSITFKLKELLLNV